MSYLWRDRSDPRMLLIGLDGIPFARLSQWADDGMLPNVAELLAEGTSGPLESTIPPTTSPAWQVCFTGKGLGSLGIYGFAEVRPFDVPPPPLVPVDSGPIVGHTLFDVLSRAGKRVIARQVRCCYPAWDINGYMQTGYPTPTPYDPRRFWPRGPETMARLMDHWAEKRRDANIPWGWFNLEQSMEACLRELRKECDVVIDDLRRMDFDCYCNIVGATDTTQHLFWLFSDPFLPITDRERRLFADVVPHAYRLIDRLMARLLDVVPTDVPIMFVSDHGGGCEATRAFRLNHWLIQQGWSRPLDPKDAVERPVPPPLRDLPDTPQRLAERRARLGRNRRSAWRRQAIPLATSYIRAMLPEGVVDTLRRIGWRPYTTPQFSRPKPHPFDMSSTQAYGYGFGECCGSVVINLRGRQGGGIVEPGEDYERLRDQIIDALTALRDPANDEPICEAVWRREELYQGPHADQAPDIVFLLHGDYRCDLSPAGPVVDNADESRIFTRSGEHTRWGTCIARGDAFGHRGSRRDDARLLDVAPTVLALMGVPVPSDMDGRVLAGWLADDVRYETGPPSPPPPTPVAARTEPDMTEEEMAQITERLRDLGYVE